MTRYNQFLKRYFNFNKYSKGFYMDSYTIDENKSKFIITNGFSIIRLNWNLNNKTLLKRFHDLELKEVENSYNKDSVLKMFENFENKGYCNNVELKESDYMTYYIKETEGKYTYNGHMIENIINLISKNKKYSVFVNDEKQAICITGEYGYAYLLPEKVY